MSQPDLSKWTNSGVAIKTDIGFSHAETVHDAQTIVEEHNALAGIYRSTIECMRQKIVRLEKEKQCVLDRVAELEAKTKEQP
jgi:hypothetical protein